MIIYEYIYMCIYIYKNTSATSTPNPWVSSFFSTFEAMYGFGGGVFFCESPRCMTCGFGGVWGYIRYTRYPLKQDGPGITVYHVCFTAVYYPMFEFVGGLLCKTKSVVKSCNDNCIPVFVYLGFFLDVR